MIIGIDAGGTNLDAVLVDGDVVDSVKIPSEESGSGIEELVAELLEGHDPDGVERVVVSTTRVLNSALQGRLPDCTNLVVPGVGLDPAEAFHGDENVVLDGCIDHRGRVTEDVSLSEDVTDIDAEAGVVSVTAKFSTRNPDIENEVRGSLEHDDDHVSLGHESGGRLGFPSRAATTVFNAKSKPLFHAFEDDLSDALDSAGVDATVYYLKGDAAMLSQDAVLSTPSHTLRSGPAASSLGLVALSGIDDAVCVDIGGTTTDLVVVEDGFPRLREGFEVHGLETFYEGVESLDLSVGGDTCVDSDGLSHERHGNAAAFGGEHPTPTDALHVLGDCEIGDTDASREALAELGDPEEVARAVVEEFVSDVVDGVESICEGGASTLVAGGVLAPYLAPRVGERVGWIDDVVVPEHAEVCGAVGCAAARVSLKTNVHIDSQRAKMTVASVGPEKVVDVGRGHEYTDEEAEEIVREETLEAAVEAGGDGDGEVEILDMRKFNVVDRSRIRGQIVEATAQVVPGLNTVFGGGR